MPRSRTLRTQLKETASAALGILLSAALSVSGQAGDILRGGVPMATEGVPRPSAQAVIGTSQARKNAQDNLARATAALESVKAMQATARRLAASAANAGQDPNHPGQSLPNVPNGLAAGGLQVAAGATVNSSLWQGANLPIQAASKGKIEVTIKQTAQQALLTWESFNIGKETSLAFDQSAGGSDASKWIAFNKVNDPSGAPSQILGSLRAEGQVYVINQNGIIFGGASQVNLHTLVASSLPINSNLLSLGLLNNPDVQFLFSSLALDAGSKGTPAFTPPAAFTPSGKSGDVIVQAGALLEAPSSAAKVGGRIALVGPNVSNQGTISTPDGQTILAAGDQVGFTAHSSSDPSLRGLDVYIGSVGAGSGNATNSGLIDAPRASVTLAGKEIQQSGVIESTTSVSLNGRIDLLASYNAIGNKNYDASNSSTGLPFLNKSSGNITLGPGSLMTILPEWNSDEKTIGTELALRSQLNLQGNTIHFGAGSLDWVPSGSVNANAGSWLFTELGGIPKSQFINAGGQIYLDAGAAIDVAGSTDISASVAQNILTLQLRGAELSDSPLQRQGVLRGPELSIDIRQSGVFNGISWQGTPLGDVSGYIGLIERTAGELTTAGGSVNLNSGGSVVLQPGSKIDVSGGWTNFKGGLVQTTKVLSRGQILDISQATPDRVYEGIYDGKFTVAHPRYGLAETYSNPLAPLGAHYEADYVQGANGGSLSITAPSMALDGNLLGQTVSGERQQSAPSVASAPPAAGRLSLAIQSQQSADGSFVSPYAPRISFSTNPAPNRVAAFSLDSNGQPPSLGLERLSQILLPVDLLGFNGFGSLHLENSDGDILVPEGISLNAAVGGEISFQAANIKIGGEISAPAGQLAFTTLNVSPFTIPTLLATPAAVAGKGNFTLGTGAVLSSAGLQVDRRFESIALALNRPQAGSYNTAGGSISIAGYNVDLEKGSLINASGGVILAGNKKPSYGNAGSIAIKAGQDPNVTSVIGGELKLGAELAGFSGAKGGALTLQAPLIRIGTAGSLSSPALKLGADFFNRGGFSRFTLNGLGAASSVAGEFVPGVLVENGTEIEPEVLSWVATPNLAATENQFVKTVLKPAAVRSSVSISLNALGVRDAFAGGLVVRGDLVLGTDTSLLAGPLGKVSLAGNTVTLRGRVEAPGGSIAVTGASNSLPLFADQLNALPTVFLAAGSLLSTAGITLESPDPYSRKMGTLLAGGAISVAGNIYAQKGAVLDVSGAADWLEVAPTGADVNARANGSVGSGIGGISGIATPLFSLATVRMEQASDAGSITLKGGQELFTHATLLGKPGASDNSSLRASGGRLSISSGRFYPEGATSLLSDPNLVVTQHQSNSTPTSTGIGILVLDSNSNPASQLGHFAADSFAKGRFDSLELNGVVQFSGPVSIHARQSLSVASQGVLYADSNVALSAAYVKLGMAFAGPVPVGAQSPPFGSSSLPIYVPPVFGGGSLEVHADLIDIGNLTLQGIGKALLEAKEGGIRGDGIVDIAGEITLKATQVYPVTATSFTIAAYDHGQVEGSITVLGEGTRSLPLSAGGNLNLFASQIHQEGVLRAPFGSITLGTTEANADPLAGGNFPVARQLELADGSVTSVSGIDPLTGRGILVPYGLNLNGTSWIDPAGTDITASGLPEKKINLAGATLSIANTATVDLRGGGDLYAYRWQSGQGGTRDILGATTSFAILPGYDFSAAPFASFTTNPAATNLGGDPGYVNSTLQIGDSIYLGRSGVLPEGTYTLLPARYALLPGGVLVTPKSGAALGSVSQTDGSFLVSGYRFNGLGESGETPASRPASRVASRFELSTGAVLKARAAYENYFANSFLKQGAISAGVTVPRLPMDGGHLQLQAIGSMALLGSIQAQAQAGRSGPTGRSGLIDINSPVNIAILAQGKNAAPGSLVLDAAQLGRFGAASLLIGGVRKSSSEGITVSVGTSEILVDNAGELLQVPDLILAAKQGLALAQGAELKASPSSLSSRSDADTLLFGTASNAGSGDGVLLRLSNVESAAVIRRGVSSSTTPTLTLASGVDLTGASLTLDSTSRTSLDSEASLNAQTINLNSGRISIQLTNPGDLTQANTGLVLAGNALDNLQGAKSLNLLSYSSFDTYGTGAFAAQGDLSIHAAEIRGFNTGGGTVSVSAAGRLLLDNSPGRSGPGSVQGVEGVLELGGRTIELGANQLAVDQFADLKLNAPEGILANGEGGLKTQGDLQATTSLLTTGQSAIQTLAAAGSLVINGPVGASTPTVASGLGGTLSLAGGGITVSTQVVLPSGVLDLHATSGDVLISGQLDVAGAVRKFHDVSRHSDGGQISLSADSGSVELAPTSTVSVAAQAEGGNAGSLSVNALNGSFIAQGILLGQGGANGTSGRFALSVGSLPSLAPINNVLNAAGFSQSRSIHVRTGNTLVDSLVKSREVHLSLDQGSITVSSAIDASGLTGGIIELNAAGSVILLPGASLSAAGQHFSNSGAGGRINLEAGSQINGSFNSAAVVDIQAGSFIDLSVADNSPASAGAGDFTGTLRLRAPQNAGATDLQINAIDGTITGASSIAVEGYKIFDLTSSGGTITTAIQNSVKSNGQTFLGTAGNASAGYAAMLSRLTVNNPGLHLILQPGAELINRTGNLTLGTTTSTSTSDWNLAPFRFGPLSAPGMLTLRAAGNIVLYNSISDGFASGAYNAALLTQNLALPANSQSWSYRFTAGADLSAAGYGAVKSSLASSAGYLQLGKNNGTNVSNSNGSNNAPGLNALTSLALTNRFQVIRAGSGAIEIHAGRSVQLLNEFASIYTAGTQVADPTMGGLFDTPILNQTGGNVTLGAIQQDPGYPAQYSLAGGDVSIFAQENIEHLTKNTAGALVADSQRQMPVNWLYRRGYVDPASGVFGTGVFGDTASTTWWVDFSNFFEGAGTLGGGNVRLSAGKDISNVDAVAATNARMIGKDALGSNIAPSGGNLLELGGGDLVINAGRNIDGGVYYVERGHGTLSAGKEITTNSTRSPSLSNLSAANVLDSRTWLPTTLFLGKGGFDLSARSNVLLGPVANPFLLPAGVNNSFWYKTYFSTYSPESFVDVNSLGGSVTLREAATLPIGSAGVATPLLQAWFQRQFLLTSSPASASYYQPWLRIDESSLQPFSTAFTLLPATLRATAFSGDTGNTGDINLLGNLTLAPAENGTLELLAGGGINGLQANGVVSPNGIKTISWGTSRINLSDADPAAIPGITNPFAYQSLVGTVLSQARQTRTDFLLSLDKLFRESGDLYGTVLQQRQQLHSPGLLHKNDPDPLRLYTLGGDISGVSLFSAKPARILARRDITDVSFYLQNLGPSDVSVVSSGRDLIPYAANSLLRIASRTAGNLANSNSGLLDGDIQISGPGTLEVLAGRNLDLGTGPANSNGTGAGIVSIGNARNPYLGFAGASLVVGAGMGLANGLGASSLDFDALIAAVKAIPALAPAFDELSLQQTGLAFDLLTGEQRDLVALQVFFRVLRETGRNYPATNSYADGFAAINALFGGDLSGSILTRGRDLRTKNGGDISLFGGSVEMANVSLGNTLSPPGIITESGGNISIATQGDVSIGLGRIFTLRGGDEIIWSSAGNIAAGSSSKTVKSAPPTRVIIDPQSADVQTDLAGLATGGGIGVLATVANVVPGNVDLIAPGGTVDAGDAGIRVTGNLNITATKVLNADNIQSAGTISGVTAAPTVAAPNLSGITAVTNAAAAATNAGTTAAAQSQAQPATEEIPSLFTVEVIGYGGGDPQEEKEGTAR